MNHPALSIGLGRPSIVAGTKPPPDLRSIPLEQISPNAHNPRRAMDDERIDELAASIRDRGLLQPIRVRRDAATGRFVIVAGHRRYEAHKRNGAKEILAIVADDRYRESDADVDAVIENLQREDVSAVDAGLSYRRLLDLWQCSQAELARRLSVSTSHVSRTLAVLDLPEDVQGKIVSGEINYQDALKAREREAAAAAKPARSRRSPRVPRGTISTPFGTVKLKRGAKLDDLVRFLAGMVDQDKRDAA
jgi:ParB family chromosome partitioning protein